MKTQNIKKMILKTQNLYIGYTSKATTKTVASEVFIQLEQGKLIGLVGANGIGKSTLLRTLTGIQKPLLGTVLLNEKPIESFDSIALAQQISVVLTEKLPPSNLTVYELIALGRQPYTNWLGKLTEEDKIQIENAISLTDISHLIHQKYYEISDGQLQKVLIARALAQNTPLIVLDEPATHLDLLHKVSLFKLLKKLTVETQKCILFSTHDIDLAIQLSDEMIVMTGKEVVQGQPCNLITQGVFTTLFQNEHIQFDASKGKFVII